MHFSTASEERGLWRGGYVTGSCKESTSLTAFECLKEYLRKIRGK